MDSIDPHTHEGVIRTDMHCHDCSRMFVAELDYDVAGNHVLECPYCGHEHCRVIRNGKITEERWDGRNGISRKAKTRRMWKHNQLEMKTSTASEHIRQHFLRHRWLNRSQ